MKLTIKRNEFLRRLSFTAQAVPSRSAEAQYRNYLLEVKEDGVSVIASDGDRSCKASSSRKDEKGNDIILSLEPGLIQVQAKTLLEIRAKLSSDIVTLVRVDTNFQKEKWASRSRSRTGRNCLIRLLMLLPQEDQSRSSSVSMSALKAESSTSWQRIPIAGQEMLSLSKTRLLNSTSPAPLRLSTG